MTVYYAAWSQSVSAIQDLFEITGPSTADTTILRMHFSQNTSEVSQQLALEFRVVSGSPTTGNGTAITPKAANGNTTRAYAGTVDRNATTQLTAGTTQLQWWEGFNVLGAFDWRATPEDEIVVPASQYFVVELPTAPTAAITINGLIVFREG